MPSGGARVPNEPAAVSGPGRFSARTDSGTAQLVAPGGSYGARQQLESQQTAAPVPVGQGGTIASGGPVAPGVAPQPNAGVFGPTERPNESSAAGSPVAFSEAPLDAKAVLRIIYQRYPSPWIASLLGD